MIDLHSHILPGIDDGSTSVDMSLEMARIAVGEGTAAIACTPHFQPGMYDTTVEQMLAAKDKLAEALEKKAIKLHLIAGGDVHISADLLERLDQERAPCLHRSKYFLFEPPHHVLPPNAREICRRLISAGYKPVLTHPERLTWIERHYDKICELFDLGVVVQITAAAVTGRFGKQPKYWSDRMLDEGRVHIVASDAHNTKSRPPGLAAARKSIEERFGAKAARQIFDLNPLAILKDEKLEAISAPTLAAEAPKQSFWPLKWRK